MNSKSIKDLPRNLFQIKCTALCHENFFSLDLSNMELSSLAGLETIENCEKIHILDLSGNHLHTISIKDILKKYQRLIYLHVAGNQFSQSDMAEIRQQQARMIGVRLAHTFQKSVTNLYRENQAELVAHYADSIKFILGCGASVFKKDFFAPSVYEYWNIIQQHEYKDIFANFVDCLAEPMQKAIDFESQFSGTCKLSSEF